MFRKNDFVYSTYWEAIYKKIWRDWVKWKIFLSLETISKMAEKLLKNIVQMIIFLTEVDFKNFLL